MTGRNTASDRSAFGTVRRAARTARRGAVLLLLAACSLLRLWLAVLALAVAVGTGWALVAVLALLLAGLFWPLRLAVFFGALELWHWPLPAALVIAAPRLVLMLPGLVAAYLASKRHPRPRWKSYRPA
jgi:hypothetical protein